MMYKNLVIPISIFLGALAIAVTLYLASTSNVNSTKKVNIKDSSEDTIVDSNIENKEELEQLREELEALKNKEPENEIKIQENKTLETEKSTAIQTKRKECDQAYIYLSKKYANIISVTYSEKLNDCMISLPDENGTLIYVKMSESTFD